MLWLPESPILAIERVGGYFLLNMRAVSSQNHDRSSRAWWIRNHQKSIDEGSRAHKKKRENPKILPVPFLVARLSTLLHPKMAIRRFPEQSSKHCLRCFVWTPCRRPTSLPLEKDTLNVSNSIILVNVSC